MFIEHCWKKYVVFWGNLDFDLKLLSQLLRACADMVILKLWFYDFVHSPNLINLVLIVYPVIGASRMQRC